MNTGNEAISSELDRKREKLEEIRREKARLAQDRNLPRNIQDSARKAEDIFQQLGLGTPARDGLFKVPLDVNVSTTSKEQRAGGDAAHRGVTPVKGLVQPHHASQALQQHALTNVKLTVKKQLDFGQNQTAGKLPLTSDNGVNDLPGNANVTSTFYRPNLQLQVGLCRSTIPPRDIVRYDRETQTSGVERAEHSSAAMDYYVLAYDDERGGASEEYKNALEHAFDDHPSVAAAGATSASATVRQKNLQLFSMSELSTEQQSLEEGADDNDSAEFGQSSLLSDEQRQSLFTNDRFLRQLKHATTVMERLLSSKSAVGPLSTSATSTSTLTLTQSTSSMSHSASSMKVMPFASDSAGTPLVDGGGGIGNSALRDYYGTYDDGDDDDDDARSGRVNVSVRARFYDDKYCRGKSISHIAMSQQHSSLIAATYEDYYLRTDLSSGGGGGLRSSLLNNNNLSGGHIMIWNLEYPNKQSADDVFRSLTSPVTTCEFNTHHRSLLIGGTESGQICMWDMRLARRTPVQTTAVSVKSHCHPVHSLHVAGATAHSHDLVSCSTDGRVCAWNIDNLSQPLEILELHHRQNRLSTTCMRFLAGDWNNMLVGTEDGQVVSAYRHGQHPGINDSYESHAGPVNSIDCHPRNENASMSASTTGGIADFSQLFLTCSFDWSVKLRCWREFAPLYTFSTFAHFVTDCRWSPAHPAVFAAADESGMVQFFNLNRETEVPVTKIDAGESLEAGNNNGTVAGVADGLQQRVPLTKLTWDLNQGYLLCCGDRSGRLSVMDARELMGPNGVVPYDEYGRFARVINDMGQRAVTGGGASLTPGKSSGPPGGDGALSSSNTTTEMNGGNLPTFSTQRAVLQTTDGASDGKTSSLLAVSNLADTASMSPSDAASRVDGATTVSATTIKVSPTGPTSAAGFFGRILGSK